MVAKSNTPKTPKFESWYYTFNNGDFLFLTQITNFTTKIFRFKSFQILSSQKK